MHEGRDGIKNMVLEQPFAYKNIILKLGHSLVG